MRRRTACRTTDCIFTATTVEESFEPVKKLLNTRDAILRRKRMRIRYRTDPVFREKAKHLALAYRKIPSKALRLKRRRQFTYWNNPEHWRQKTKEWIANNREKWLANSAKMRKAKRLELRARAQLESELCTDSYVRNQLSKYSHKSTKEWTEEEVEAKRNQIINNRRRRVTNENADLMRKLYQDGITAEQLAARFKTSVSNVYMILADKTHVAGLDRVRHTLGMIDRAAKVTKTLADFERLKRKREKLQAEISKIEQST